MSKKYLVIGGSSGIGKAVVEKLSNLNEVYASYHQHPNEPTDKVHFFPYDSGSSKEIAVDAEWLDGIVYCPGTINLKPFHRLTTEDFLKDFEINLLGAVRAIQSVLHLLKKSEQASIVLFSTVAVQQGMGFHSSVAASKGAVEGFARSLAAELAPKIRVNVIAPSIVNTPLSERLLNSEDKVKASEKRHPLQKIGVADDIAAMAAFLLGDEASWITGQVIKVDGGLSSIKML